MIHVRLISMVELVITEEFTGHLITGHCSSILSHLLLFCNKTYMGFISSTAIVQSQVYHHHLHISFSSSQ